MYYTFFFRYKFYDIVPGVKGVLDTVGRDHHHIITAIDASLRGIDIPPDRDTFLNSDIRIGSGRKGAVYDLYLFTGVLGFCSLRFGFLGFILLGLGVFTFRIRDFGRVRFRFSGFTLRPGSLRLRN